MSIETKKVLFLGLVCAIGSYIYAHSSNAPQDRAAQINKVPLFALKTPEDLPNLKAQIESTFEGKKGGGDLPQEKKVEKPSISSGNSLPSEKLPLRGYVPELKDQPNSEFVRFGTALPRDPNAQAAVIADARTGTLLYVINPKKRWPLASLTKLMTAVAFEAQARNMDEITFAPHHFLFQNHVSYFKPGERYLASDVMRAMLLASSNEAGEALADHLGRTNMLTRMNQFANEWDLADTHFDDPTGISASNQSTVADLAVFVKNINTRYPQIFEISRDAKWIMTELVSGSTREVKTINLFAGRADFLGGKTGYTEDANGNLLSLFSHNGRPVLIAILGTNDRFGETEKLLNWFIQNYR